MPLEDAGLTPDRLSDSSASSERLTSAAAHVRELPVSVQDLVREGRLHAQAAMKHVETGLVEADFGQPRRDVSRIRTATTTPDPKVSAATSHMAAGNPKASAVTPARTAPNA